MENQMIYSSYGADDNAITEPYFVDRDDDDAYQDNIEVVDGEYHVTNKVAVSASSPTCVVLAVDERLRDSVFRAVDVPIDEDDHRYNNNQAHAVEANALLRPTTRRLTLSSDTDFSSSSEDTEELASSSSSSSDNSRRQRTLGIRRTASSIFRPLSGTKRHCVFEGYSHNNDDEVDNDGDDSCIIPKMPSLCRAHRVGRSDDYAYEDQDCDEDAGKISLSSTYSFASAFKRICRSSSSSISSSTSQTTATSIVVMDESQSLEEEDVYQAGSKSTTTRIAASAFEHLQHPLSSMLVATISSSVSSSIDEIVN
jgi:hypothetical protein